MTDQSTPEGKTDLLTPDDVREMLTGVNFYPEWHRLCRDYLTLWDDRDNERQIANDVVKSWHIEKRSADRLERRVEELERILNARETLGDLLR